MRTLAERILANKLRKEGKTYLEISGILGINKEEARNLIRYPIKHNQKKRGRKFKLVPKYQLKVKRSIACMKERQEKINCAKILREIDLNISQRTLQRYMKKAGYIYQNAKSRIFLNKNQKQERIRLITEWISSRHDWNFTIFSDEKKFNLDGPDNWYSYRRKSQPLLRQKRQCRGGGVLVWLMVMPNGLLSYTILDGIFNSAKYLRLLQERIVPVIKLNYPNNIWYQDDNCSVHRAKIIKNYMISTGIRLLDWPSKSPDINIVEDIWHMISNKVYDGPQFRQKSELIEKINRAILELNKSDRDSIMKLYGGINNRLCHILSKQGDLFNK